MIVRPKAKGIVRSRIRDNKPESDRFRSLRRGVLGMGAILLLSNVSPPSARADFLVPMDLSQTNHLKAYGLAYHILARGENVKWLLNYRGGSFLIPDKSAFSMEAQVRSVKLERVDGAQIASIMREINDSNADVILLEKAPAIAIYAPPNKQPWDDAVMLALKYADIPYTVVYDQEVLAGELEKYDWLHLHHEDFTGQYGKFYANYSTQQWYIDQVSMKVIDGFSRENVNKGETE